MNAPFQPGDRVRVVHMRNAVSELGTVVAVRAPDQLDHWRIQISHDDVPTDMRPDPTEPSGDPRLWWWVADALKLLGNQ